MADTTTRSALDDFLDVVLADEQFLRAEFEAILSTQWPNIEEPVRPAHRRRWPTPDQPTWWWLRLGRPHRSRFPREVWTRDRSPPDISPANRTEGKGVMASTYETPRH
jgi:hypothetical protein